MLLDKTKDKVASFDNFGIHEIKCIDFRYYGQALRCIKSRCKECVAHIKNW